MLLLLAELNKNRKSGKSWNQTWASLCTHFKWFADREPKLLSGKQNADQTDGRTYKRTCVKVKCPQMTSGGGIKIYNSTKSLCTLGKL